MKIDETIQEMRILGKQIIEVSRELIATESDGSDNTKYHLTLHKQLKNSKNELISQLMNLIRECRNMRLKEADRATLESAIAKLNTELYDATSLTII